MAGMRIVGWGTALPDKTVTNADLEGRLDTSDAWISERTGIRERRIGDSTAALVGKGWGRTRFFRKTLEGALGGLTACLAWATFLVVTGHLDWQVALFGALVWFGLGVMRRHRRRKERRAARRG